MNDFWTRLSYALRCFYSLLLHGQIPSDVLKQLAPSGVSQPEKAVAAAVPDPMARIKENDKVPAGDPSDRVVQMLALLQRDSRLIDFLTEDVSPYPDAQLGAAVRSIHQNCRQVLDQYVKLEPIINSVEDQPVTVEAGFNPAAIKLIGNVTGQPPVRGLLRHRGWRVKEVNLPSLPEKDGRSVLAPAEVELS